MDNAGTAGPVVCAWCAAEMRRGNLSSPLSHGICLPCMAGAAGQPVEDLSGIDADLLDALPFGAIQLSGDGVIVGYSRGESTLSGLAAKDVIGKHFFRDVAPCASVKEFAGKFAELRSGGRSGLVKLRFVFKYARGAKLVEIAMVHDAATDITTLLVKAMLSEPNL
jgi:photoactive yellow protein